MNKIILSFSSCSLFIEYRQFSHNESKQIEGSCPLGREPICACIVQGHLAVT